MNSADLSLTERLRVIAQWDTPGAKTPKCRPDKQKTCTEAADEIDRLRVRVVQLLAERDALVPVLRLARRSLNGGRDTLTPKEHQEAWCLVRDAIARLTGEPT